MSAAPSPAQLNARRTAQGLVATIVISLLVMWGTIAWFLLQSRASDLAAEKRVLERMVTAVEEQTSHLFGLVRLFLMASDLWFQKHPQADPRTDADYLKLVDLFRAQTGQRIDIRVVSEDGGLFYLPSQESPAGAVPKPLALVPDRDYFQAQAPLQTRGLFIAKPVLSRVTGQWGLPISYPLHSKPHGIAVVFAAIENRMLEPPYEAARTKPSGTILLAHRDGTLLFRAPGSEKVGQTLADGEIWRLHLPRKDADVVQVDAPLVDGQPRLIAYAALRDFPLVVVASSTLADVLAAWQRRLHAALLLGTAMTALGLLVLWRLLGSLRALETKRRHFEAQAHVDELTQVPNRRFFVERSLLELARAQRYGRPLSALMLDLDHFKAINDSHGHAAGDEVLRAVSTAVQEALREADLLGRVGGEEFAVLLPETGAELAVEVAQRVRQRVEALRIVQDGAALPVTVSVGVASLLPGQDDLDRLFGRADEALYAAKAAGRNCVRLCTDAAPAAHELGRIGAA